MASLNLLVIISIIAIAINSRASDGARILGIFPLNGKSHFIICEQLMKILAKAGHQVDVVSHFPLKKSFSNYNDLSLYGSMPSATNNISYSEVQSFSASNLEHFMDLTGNKVCDLLKHPTLNNIIKNPPSDPPYDLLIVEIFAAPCYFAFSRLLKVPMIGVTTAALYDWTHEPLGNPTNFAIAPGTFTDLPTKMNFWQRLQNVFMINLVQYQYNYHASLQKKFVDKYFGPGYPSIDELSRKFDIVFVNSHHSLNGVKPMTTGVVEVGGVHIEDTGEKLIPELQKWLDESKHGCIYVSFGSMVRIETFPKEILDAFYAAFRNIAPVRVLMKIAKKEDLPSGLPKNVKTYHWLPQIQILKHKNVKAFVTHGGLMGTLESIYAGVPMIGLPLFGDQPQNIKLYVKQKIAVFLDYRNVNEKKITDALNTILNNPEYRDNIKKKSQLYFDRPISPQDSVLFWTEYVLRNGNVLRSPAIDLTWWQVQLLDVYGFILLIILSILYVAFLIIKIFHKFICNRKKNEREELSQKKIK